MLPLRCPKACYPGPGLGSAEKQNRPEPGFRVRTCGKLSGSYNLGPSFCRWCRQGADQSRSRLSEPPKVPHQHKKPPSLSNALMSRCTVPRNRIATNDLPLFCARAQQEQNPFQDHRQPAPEHSQDIPRQSPRNQNLLKASPSCQQLHTFCQALQDSLKPPNSKRSLNA